MKSNYDAAVQKYWKISNLIALFDEKMSNLSDKSALVDALFRFRHEVGIRQTLGDLGVTKADIPRLAKNAFNDACVATNPKLATIQDIEMIYEQAL